MMPLRVAALDLSLTSTGVAYGQTPDRVTTRTIAPFSDGWARVDHIMVEIANVMAKAMPHLLVVERAWTGAQHGDTALRLAELRGVVLHWLWRRWPQCPQVEVSPATLKVYATGKGRGPGTEKAAVMLEMQRRYGHLAYAKTDDEADALCMMAMACDWYRDPLAGYLPSNAYRRALRSVQWPALSATKPWSATP